MFLKFGFLTRSFTSSVIVLLIKCISGDLTDVNNYRAIAFSSALLSVFEHIIALHIYTVAESNHFQFDFKFGHSTSLYTTVFKCAVEHYINRGSHVFVCVIDFSQAFVKVDYWKLVKVLNDNFEIGITRVFAY
jgi:hypothetical protein